jgi:hypothetical protein
VAPHAFVEVVRAIQDPPAIYFAALVRLAFGVVLIAAAPRSRAPLALRVLGALVTLGGLLTPFFGVEFARVILGWWSEGGAVVVRGWASAALAIGAFIIYATVAATVQSPMPNALRNVLALLAGILIGGGVNTALITLGPWLIPPPAGVDVSSAEGLGRAIHLFEPRHFIMPFLAHAIGTLVGALAAYLIAASYKAQMAYVIGAVFLCGGVAASFMIPAPAWFIALDLLAAYLPMAWLGIAMGTRMNRGTTRKERG